MISNLSAQQESSICSTQVSEPEFCLATTEKDFAQIRALNYQTFVEEIPQHEKNETGLLRDRFEDESLYVICRQENEVVGMLALRAHRPFSLDSKLDDLDRYLPPHSSACEVRLLSIRPSRRHSRILGGLFHEVGQLCRMRGHDLLLISGTVRETRLNTHIGFTPFGPLVGKGDALYQPMWLNREGIHRQAGLRGRHLIEEELRTAVNLFPGPVDLPPATEAAVRGGSVSHRSETFMSLFHHVQRMLCGMTCSPRVAVTAGSGTTANEIVAGQLAQMEGRGLVLVNGEFGERLADHARRFQLTAEMVRVPWGQSLDIGEIENKLSSRNFSWIWAVHAETSTGVLNDLNALKHLARRYGVSLALDCVSSLGVVPCDLHGVAFASSASGKGLRSLAGLALVFYQEPLPESRRPAPATLDLSLLHRDDIVHTIPSRLVAALSVSLETLVSGTPFAVYQEEAHRLRQALLVRGIPILAPAAYQFPGILTLPLPAGCSSEALWAALEARGWWISCRSHYLLERNWIQISLMGCLDPSRIEPLPDLLAELLPEYRVCWPGDVQCDLKASGGGGFGGGGAGRPWLRVPYVRLRHFAD